MKLVKLLFSSWLLIVLSACNTNEETTVKVILDSKVPLDSLSLVTDNDDGTSDLIKAQLIIQED